MEKCTRNVCRIIAREETTERFSGIYEKIILK
jgi:hypothetical protein